jgi:hypothetical protein
MRSVAAADFPAVFINAEQKFTLLVQKSRFLCKLAEAVRQKGSMHGLSWQIFRGTHVAHTVIAKAGRAAGFALPIRREGTNGVRV